MSTAVSNDALGDADPSAPAFRTLHALRIKGFAKVEVIAEIADIPVVDAHEHLVALQLSELTVFREPRALWQLTPAGREAHARMLSEDVAGAADLRQLQAPYRSFLRLNDELKTLCGRWQLRAGELNDHGDARYDGLVIGDLVHLHGRAVPVVEDMAHAVSRLGAYGRRLGEACQRFAGGETNMFTGVMCGSYHDVWMELHEDLILSQGIERAAEGSF